MIPAQTRRPLSVGLVLFAGILLFCCVDVLLIALTPDTGIQEGWGFRGNGLLLALPFGAIAGLVLHRYPRHTVGWLMMTLSTFAVADELSQQYMIYALVAAPDGLPGGVIAAWLSNWVWTLGMALIPLIVLLFPTGRLPSPRWRPIVWLWLAVAGVMSLSLAVSPGLIAYDQLSIENPVGWEGGKALTEIGFSAAWIGWLGLMIIAAISLITRYLRARGDTRQQIKWLGFSVGIIALCFPAAAAPSRVIQIAYIAAVVFLPVSMGIAILRYRLWDIDVVIRRTLVYGLVTGMLAAIYFGSVAVMQSAFVTLTGQESPLAIVASTLAIAALFTPVRSRIQRAVDRRFFRRKYNAEKTIDSFAAAVRDEVDIERLQGTLISVVEDTMQPAHVSLWLRR